MDNIEQKIRSILNWNTRTITNAMTQRNERVIKEQDFNMVIMSIANLINSEKQLKSKIDR